MEHLLETEWRDWLLSFGFLAGAVVAGLLAHGLLFAALGEVSRKTGSIVDASLVRRGRMPARLLFSLLAVLFVIPLLRLSPAAVEGIRHAVELGLIAAAGWLAISLLAVFDDVVSARNKIDVKDNLAARKIRTKTHLLRRVSVTGIIIVAAALMLMTFPRIRNVGISLFASAGIAGLAIGIAARPVLSNIMAGVQIAITEPIRIDDVVIVEGEWGWIEEIGSTYVVVRVWDLRRLVVPLTYFIERPFQNWTRKTADLLGTVFLYTDYSVPVDEVRQELRRVLGATELWDGKAWGLQVTNATERVMELRALMSAADSDAAWDLRCHVREQLIRFLQERYPRSLPRVRAEIVEGTQRGDGQA